MADYKEKVNTNDPYDIAKFEKKCANFVHTIKDGTLQKYILEDYLTKINNLTPNVNLKISQLFKKSKF